jgi:pilus assembly protein Flp/PilA
MKARIRRSLLARRSERGASAVEYALMVAAIAAVIVVVVFALGGVVNSAFDNTTDCLVSQGVGPGMPDCPDRP